MALPIPNKLPVWAYLAAAGGAFVVARAAQAGAGTTDDQATDQPDAASAPPASAGSLWDGFNDGGALEGGQLTGGIFPPAGSIADLTGGQPIPVTITDANGEPIDFTGQGQAFPPGPSPSPVPPDVAPKPGPGHSVRFGPGTYRSYTLNSKGKVTGWHDVHFPNGFSANCTAAANHEWVSSRTRIYRLVRITSGAHKGVWLDVTKAIRYV